MPSFFFSIAFDLDSARPNLQPNPTGGSRTRSVKNLAAVNPNAERSLPTPPSSNSKAASGIAASPSLSNDWRYDKISVQNISMAPPAAPDKSGGETAHHMTNGFNPGPGGLATKGRYEPVDTEEEDVGWGVVRLYRDSEETPGLYDEPTTTKHTTSGRHVTKKENESPFRDEDCTTLSILAVPSYLTPSDFLGFVGEKTRDEVSHFRMIRTERGNRYMVLMKFRNGKKAREWRGEWNGMAFDGMEVGTASLCYRSKSDKLSYSQRTVTSSSLSPSSFGPMSSQAMNLPFPI